MEEVIAFASEIHSLDRLALAVALERRLQKEGRAIDVLLQVNTSGEASKFGLSPSDLPSFLRELAPLGTLRLRGLMTLAVLSDDRDAVRTCFRTLRDLRDRLRQDAREGAGLTELSMGMSQDFALAVEEGATVVRLGEAIFGPRLVRPPGGWWPE